MISRSVIDKGRIELATLSFDQGLHWRILFFGQSVNGSTDIVSCLSRSLRNLGHQVLDIDLKRHRGLTDNPTRAMGGNGPIYLRLGQIEQIVDRFRPQVIVCCAGGLTFRPEDAAELKRRGIVLIGITLSDPDVFPTIHPHAHVFDFHTTNARVALAMYRDKGVRNTLYFPFGIDRGFVTQSVPSAPELAADVICIGHATARPERNQIMARLARQFRVRTYGRGWEIPGSQAVEGKRMVQASREGRIHVNFPLTRAGYINIKCGVFESIGSGALVCSGRFEEMEDFFAYDEEIIGYTDEEDLASQIATVLADSERYRHMTERAFQRLITQHLYEHRWMALFDQILATARSSPDWLGPERSAQVLQSLSASRPRAKHIVVSGFYGASNVGDELILRSISERLQSASPAIQVWVASENPDRVERGHGLQSFPRKSHWQALHAARTASAVVLGGGGLWHDYTFERSGGLLGLFHSPQISIAGFGALPLMGRMFGAPFHVVGMGIGPLDDPDAKRMVRFLASHADSIMVRDAESARIASEVCPFPERVRQAPDVVYGLALPKIDPPIELAALRKQGRRLVGLNLRPWAHASEEALLDAVTAALRSIGERDSIAVVGIPMQAGDRMDPWILRRAAERIGEALPMFLLKAPLSSDQLIGALEALDVLVSMRLHACLLAHRLHRPVVGLAYDPKVANHFAELDRSQMCLPLPLRTETLEARIEQALAERGQLPQPVIARISELESKAEAALDETVSRIAMTPARDAVFEVPRVNGGDLAAAAPRVQTPAASSAGKAPPARPPATPKAAAASTSGRAAATGASRPPKATAAHKPVRSGVAVSKATAARKPAPSRVAANPVRKQAPNARFVETICTVDGNLVLPASPEAFANGVQLCAWLPTDHPVPGDRMELRGALEIAAAGEIEISLRLASEYANPGAIRRVRYELDLDDTHRFSEDLAENAAPVQLRFFTTGGRRIPVRLSVQVERPCFASKAWPKASRVCLQLTRVANSHHSCASQALSSRSSFSAIQPDQLSVRQDAAAAERSLGSTISAYWKNLRSRIKDQGR